MYPKSLAQRNAVLLVMSVVVIAAAFAMYVPTSYARCINIYGSESTSPNGYGVVWNPFSGILEMLVEGITCTTASATIQVGSTRGEQFVYNKGYYWAGSQWKTYSLTGTSALQNNAWYTGPATGPISLGTGFTYVVGYVCQKVDGIWKCGCRDESCATAYWQLQAVAGLPSPTGGGGGSGGGGGGDEGDDGYGTGGGTSATGKLLDPPTMDNALVVENVCPEDSRWPSNAQMAGRDVKITMPKDRICRKVGNMGGTKASPAHDIWLSGGELVVHSDAPKNGAGLTTTYWTGTLFIEGMNIDITDSCMDGIRTYYPRSGRVVLQNSVVRGMSYCDPGTHGDLFHAQGGDGGNNIRELVAQNIRGDLENQGFFVPLRANGHGVRRLVLDHVELRLDPRYRFFKNKISTMIFADPTGGGGNQYPPDGQAYNEVYLNWWDPWYPSTTGRLNITLPSPSSYDSKGCAVFSSGTRSAAKLDGTWCKGAPPGGTFVPLDKIGRNYDRSFFTNRQ